MKKGILVHIIKGATESEKYWVSSEMDIDALGLGGELSGALRVFFGSKEQMYFSRLSSSAFGSQDLVLVIAERLVDRRTLLVFGAGHVGFNIAVMGVMIGFNVVLFDDRNEFLEKAAVVDERIQCLLGDFDKIGGSVRIGKDSAVVIVTRGHQCDEVILKQIANYNPGYVGMIGSRRRVQSVFRRLREQGVSSSFLERVKAPIGLDIGAKTPQEIGVSVHAEIIQHFSSANS